MDNNLDLLRILPQDISAEWCVQKFEPLVWNDVVRKFVV